MMSSLKKLWKSSAKLRLAIFTILHVSDLVTDIILGVEFIIGYTTTQDLCQEFLTETTLVSGIALIIVSLIGFCIGMWDIIYSFGVRDEPGVPHFIGKLCSIIIEDGVTIIICVTVAQQLGTVSTAWRLSVTLSIIGIFISMCNMQIGCCRASCCVGWNDKASNEKRDEDGSISETPCNEHPGGTCFMLCFTSLFMLAIIWLMYSAVTDMQTSDQGTLIMSIDDECGYVLDDSGWTNYDLEVVYEDCRAVACELTLNCYVRNVASYIEDGEDDLLLQQNMTCRASDHDGQLCSFEVELGTCKDVDAADCYYLIDRDVTACYDYVA